MVVVLVLCIRLGYCEKLHVCVAGLPWLPDWSSVAIIRGWEVEDRACTFPIMGCCEIEILPLAWCSISMATGGGVIQGPIELGNV